MDEGETENKIKPVREKENGERVLSFGVWCLCFTVGIASVMILVVRIDDVLDQPVPHHVVPVEVDERNPLHSLQYLLYLYQTRA